MGYRNKLEPIKIQSNNTRKKRLTVRVSWWVVGTLIQS